MLVSLPFQVVKTFLNMYLKLLIKLAKQRLNHMADLADDLSHQQLCSLHIIRTMLCN